MKKLIIALVAVAAAAGGGVYYSGILTPAADAATPATDSHGAPIVASTAPLYLTLDPPFVVNFMHRGTMRYLQLSLDLMFHEQAMLDKVKERMPQIRNDLILLLSNQEFETLSSAEGKEELRTRIMHAVAVVLELDADAEHDTGEAYFTNFVMQ